jgi:hypothetical protein
MNMDYNGWTNRETWATNLWIENEYALAKDLEVFYMEMHQDGDELLETTPEMVRQFADYIEQVITELLSFENMTRSTYSMLTDIGSLYRVNWYEIAQSNREKMEE